MSTFNFAIAAIFKNELEYVIEWLAHHRLLGIEKFFIADNQSDDGTSELLQALDYAGFITRIPFPRIDKNVGPQALAYNYIINNYGDEIDLIGFIDADEFLYADGGVDFLDTLAGLCGIDGCSAIGINWAVFGSGGASRKAIGNVTSRFVRRGYQDYFNNYHIKSLVRPKFVEKMQIHHASLSSGRYVNTKGEFIDFPGSEHVGPKTSNVIWDKIRLNHYVVKSYSELMEKKSNKGSAAGSSSRVKGEEYFKVHDVNDVLDNSLLAQHDSLQKEMLSIEAVLRKNTPYFSYSIGYANIVDQVLSGWVISDFKSEELLRVLITIDNVEHQCLVNRARPDIVRKGLSDNSICGFSMRLPRIISDVSELEVTVYGSSCSLPISFS